MQINELWNSKNEQDYINAINKYWEYIKPENLELEERLNNLDCRKIEAMDLSEFYGFLIDDYYKWKYTDPRWLNQNRERFSKYVEQQQLCELEEIKNSLFSFDPDDIEAGLKIAQSTKGLGVAGASGLLALLYPNHFATVDQFVVKSLCEVKNLPQRSRVQNINPSSISIKDGILLIEIMRDKAKELNRLFGTNEWTPRSIDMILWASR